MDRREPALAAAISGATFRIDAHAVPLDDVEAAWREWDGSQRVVVVP